MSDNAMQDIATPTPVQNDPSRTLGINFVGQSPHVFVYRIWRKGPGAANWTVVCDENTVDQVPDFVSVGPLPDNTQLSYWVAVAGKAQSVFRFSLIFTQDGRVPMGGTVQHQDTTSDKGGAVVEGSVILV